LEYDFVIQKVPDNNANEVKDTTMKVNKLNFDAKIINEGTTTVNGMPAYHIVYTMKDPNVSEEMKNSLYLIEKGNNVYALEFKAYSVVNFDKYAKISEDILTTYK